MKPYSISPVAREDVLEIWNYLADRASVEVADRIVGDLRSAMEKLSEFPGMGHLREDLADKLLKFWLVHSYFIIYREGPDFLEIARVLHTARDIKSILSET